MMWWVYDEHGEVVTSAEADSVANALAQFRYASATWFAVPDGFDVRRVGGRGDLP